ncbi:MAG TPA: glycosyl hydrolase 53 family protein [Candidatus Didemnitutus sp.]|nr:glycosyl hydrolase 53 family protein [Candidatus Didemnitutus sp.]
MRWIVMAFIAAVLTGWVSAATEPFVLGADITYLDARMPARWGKFPPYQENGQPSDELTILHRHGWNAFRLRIFVSPVHGAPNNTLEAAIPLAKRIKALGGTLLLCLHFSDTWADPQHQDIPVAWRGLDLAGLEQAWEEHAFMVVKTLKDAGAMPDWVQVGNEITRGAAWPVAQLQYPGTKEYPPPAGYDEAVQWDHLTRLLKAGIRGVRAGAGGAPVRIAIHIDKGASWRVTNWFFDHIEAAHVPYDIIAQSFYPPWAHGTLEQLTENMNRCAETYHKDFLVVETGYENSHVKENPYMKWPQTPEGRRQFLTDLIRAVKAAPGGIGVMYWEPERDLWNDDGSPGPGVLVLEK